MDKVMVFVVSNQPSKSLANGMAWDGMGWEYPLL